MKILHLTLKKEWFDLIKSGEKKEEFREIKPYWIKRLTNQYSMPYTDNMLQTKKKFDLIHFRNGYKPDSPLMIVEWKGLKFGKFEGNKVFAIQLGEVKEVYETGSIK